MGCTDLSEAQVKEVLHEISHEFVGTSYNLLTRNCNHFTHELCKKLTNKGAPGWINRAAKLGTMFPCVIPDEWIEPPEYEAENSSKYKENHLGENVEESVLVYCFLPFLILFCQLLYSLPHPSTVTATLYHLQCPTLLVRH